MSSFFLYISDLFQYFDDSPIRSQVLAEPAPESSDIHWFPDSQGHQSTGSQTRSNSQEFLTACHQKSLTADYQELLKSGSLEIPRTGTQGPPRTGSCTVSNTGSQGLVDTGSQELQSSGSQGLQSSGSVYTPPSSDSLSSTATSENSQSSNPNKVTLTGRSFIVTFIQLNSLLAICRSHGCGDYILDSNKEYSVNGNCMQF